MLTLTLEDAILGCGRIAAGGMLIVTLEALALMRLPATLFCDWRVASLRHPLTATGRWASCLDIAQRRPLFWLVLASLGTASVLLLGTTRVGPIGAVASWTATLALLLLFARAPFGLDGADQMLLLLAVALAVAHTCPSTTAKAIAILFIAGQATLAYATAGLAKLFSRRWIVEPCLSDILATHIYGQPRLAAVLRRHPGVAMLAQWSIVASEVVFGIAVFLGDSNFAAVALLSVALLHIGAAILMGLNTFSWAFIASYPAIMYTRGLLTSV